MRKTVVLLVNSERCQRAQNLSDEQLAAQLERHKIKVEKIINEERMRLFQSVLAILPKPLFLTVDSLTSRDIALICVK